MEFSLLEASNGECPYIKGKEWLSYLIQSKKLDPFTYELLLDQGFRRSGPIFYKNNCDSCEECISLRIKVADFAPSKSQKRALKKNIDVRITEGPAIFDLEAFAVYSAFSKDRYDNEPTVEDFHNFLANGLFDTRMVKYYAGDQLIGVGWLDILANSISSVYFAFDPAASSRSLGTYSVIKEIELCQKLGLEYLHLGFWVKDCQAMAYKNRFQPYELLINGRWNQA